MVFGSSTRDPRNARSPAKIRMFLGFHIPNVQPTVDYLLSLKRDGRGELDRAGFANSTLNASYWYHTSEEEEPDSQHEKEKIQTNDVDVSSKMMRREEGTPAASLLCRDSYALSRTHCADT
jgi:hypothetical protein